MNNNKMNPWMICTVVLAMMVGLLVGILANNSPEAQASEGPQWEYMSGTLSQVNIPYVVRVDVSDPNPIPELYAIVPEVKGTFSRITNVNHWSKSKHTPPKTKKK